MGQRLKRVLKTQTYIVTLNRNYKIGIVAAVIAAIMITVPVYLYWAYGTPESLYRRGLATPFWLSLDSDSRDVSVSQGETKIVPVELHHWKDLDTALYVELRSNDGSSMEKYPEGLSVSFDLDSSVISLSNGGVMVLSKNEAARFNPPMIKQVNGDGQMVVREFGNLTVSASKNVPLGPYYFELSSGDTKIDGGGGNGQLLTVTVVDDNSEIVEFKPKYNHTEIPDLHMVVKSTGKIYAGEGSYCLNSVCGDIFTLVPENTIPLHRGEEIQFRIVNYRPPEDLV